mmetsp:Transcript_24889/g.42920  ORF Transcript_24889/g.42920 Transcript_24889/m.42920 type:complete len:99 (+) Transcript_24889:242-538(+)
MTPRGSAAEMFLKGLFCLPRKRQRLTKSGKAARKFSDLDSWGGSRHDDAQAAPIRESKNRRPITPSRLWNSFGTKRASKDASAPSKWQGLMGSVKAYS